MPRGTWDWATNPAGLIFVPNLDLAEIAVRLGSIVSHDRRGDVMFLDSFESGKEKWAETISGDGAAVDLATDQARNGAYSVLLTAGTTNAMYAQVTHFVPFPELGPMGFEFGFLPLTGLTALWWHMDVYSGTTRTRFRVRWRGSDNDLQYEDSAGTWVTFATDVTPFSGSTLFNVGKLVADPSTGDHVRFLLNDVTYSLAGIAGSSVATGTDAHLTMAALAFGDSIANRQCYVDDFILTRNEP